MKKVLFVINTMGRGGAERCLLHMINAMHDNWQAEEYCFALFSVLNKGELFTEVPEYVRIMNENPNEESVFDGKARKGFAKRILQGALQNGYVFRNLGSLCRLFFWQLKNKKISVKKLCWKLISDTAEPIEEEYDLVVGYLQGAATYYAIDRVKAAKKILFVHNDFAASGNCPWWDQPYYEKADKIYCVSQNATSKLKEIYPSCKEKIETLYNFANVNWVKERAAQKPADEDYLKIKNKPSDTLCLMTAARLEPHKAFDKAIQAMACLKRMGVKAVWYVLGDGSLRKQLQKEIEEQDVAECFFLLGQKDNPYPYLAACDIYVQETLYEGFCTSITEAVILGKRVVASDCDGNKEQLAYYNTGILTPLEPEAIAKGILQAASMEPGNVDVSMIQEKSLEQLKLDMEGNA